MHRFFVPPSCIDGNTAVLAGPIARQLATVLRARPGDRIALLDDTGWEYLVTLDSVAPQRVQGVVTKRRASDGEPGTRITLYQAVLKADRFEFVLQKCTELGVTTFVPVIAARSVPRVGNGWASKRYPRWRRILSEAAEQSGRGRLPALAPPVDFDSACDTATGVCIIPWERESATGIRVALRNARRNAVLGDGVSVFTGPEGGLTAQEMEHAVASGVVPVSLGRRILRSETAAVVAVAAIQYEMGELGG